MTTGCWGSKKSSSSSLAILKNDETGVRHMHVGFHGNLDGFCNDFRELGVWQIGKWSERWPKKLKLKKCSRTWRLSFLRLWIYFTTRWNILHKEDGIFLSKFFVQIISSELVIPCMGSRVVLSWETKGTLLKLVSNRVHKKNNVSK